MTTLSSLVIGSTASYHYDNLQCHQRPQSCQIDDLWFAGLVPSGAYMEKYLILVSSGNGLSSFGRQDISKTNVELLSIEHSGGTFSEIVINFCIDKIHFSFKKIRFKRSTAKWRPFCRCHWNLIMLGHRHAQWWPQRSFKVTLVLHNLQNVSVDQIILFRMTEDVLLDLEALRETLQWRHNDRDSVSSHRRLSCLINRLSRCRSKKHHSSASLAFVRGIQRWPVNSPHKGQ